MPDCSQCGRAFGKRLARCHRCGACSRCCDCGDEMQLTPFDADELGLDPDDDADFLARGEED